MSRVDVMFRNIKHAFFQPADNELISLLHLHLHNPIMVGNKKTKDVQFYVEVREANESVGGGPRRSTWDPDEIEEEQRERARRNKINQDLKEFSRRCQDQWEKDFPDMILEFDIPFRDLGFHGVPYKSSSFIVPTVYCLVELIETPFMVVTLSEIEVVNLERVGQGQKTFDMAIVFKDFTREILRIDAIPSTSLDAVKEWLNSMSIKYYESRLNMNWKSVLKDIMADPEILLEKGWEFLNMEGSDSDEDGSQESEAYEPSDVEMQASDESEDDSEDDESVVDSEEEEEEEEEGEGDEEEEGLTWDELEERAEKEEAELGEEEDSEEERRKRKAKGRSGGGGGGAPNGRSAAMNGRPPVARAGGPQAPQRRPGGGGAPPKRQKF